MPEQLLKNKLSSWDQGGSLNQLALPSEIPLRDAMESLNWKVDRDGKSRVKRLGYDVLDAAYASFGEPIRGIFKYTDPDGNEKIVIITRSKVVVREDIYTWTRKYHDTDTFYDVDIRAPFLYQDKLCILADNSGTTIQILQTLDGDTWTVLDTFTPTIGPNQNQGQCTGVFADEIFFGLVGSGATDELVCRYDGVFNEELPAPYGGMTTIALHSWDGKLWILTYRTGGYTVYSYDGNAYSQISNYDGAGELPTGSAQLFISDIRNRLARFFTWNNDLHLAVTTKDGGGKWTWEIHRFNATLYDRFNKIYDSTGTDDYGICSYYEFGGKAWVITQKLDYAGDANPDGNDNKIYSSEDLITWTLVNGSLVMGCIEGEAFHDGKMFVSSFKNWAAARSYQIWYWDSQAEEFVSEINITTNAAPASHGHGDLIEFKGELYGGKYREVHRRELSTNTYTEISSISEVINRPVAGVVFDDGRLIVALNEMIVVEGSTVYTLGLQPPVSALTATADGNVVIDATNNKMDFEETDGAELTATLSNASYAPAALAAEIKTRLDAAGASTYTVTYEDTNVFKIVSDGSGGGNALNLLCFSGTNVAASVWVTIGFGSIDLNTAVLPDLSYEANLGWALTGGYLYVVTYYRSGNYPVESNPSPESTIVYPDGEKLDLSSIPISPDPKCDTRRIYRTTAGGSTFYWLDDIDDNTTTTYEDDINDDTLLGGDEVSYDRGVPPLGKYMEVWDNRLWIAGVEEHPNFLYRTNTGTSEEMASTNFIQVRARESAVITQIKAFGDRLYVFKAESMHRVSKMGATYYEVEKMPQDIGTDSPWSVAVCDKFMLWKSQYGIEVFNGNSCYRGQDIPLVSDLVETTMATINDQALEKIVGSHNFQDGEYWLAIPTGSETEPDKVVGVNYLRRSLFIYSFPEKLTFLMSTKTKADGLLFLTGTSEGNIYIQSSGYNDDGTNISASWRTGWINVSGEREAWNILRRLFLKYALPENKTLTVNIYADFNKTAVVALSFAGNTPSTTPTIRNEILARQDLRIPGYYVSFEFVNNEDTGGEVRVSGWDAFFRKQLWQHTAEGD